MDNLASHNSGGNVGTLPLFPNPLEENEQLSTPVDLCLDGYEFEQKIGEGGMATVYKGRQISLQRPVAIKVLNQTLAAHSQVYEAFEREAVIIAQLNHPNIVQVIDRGLSQSNGNAEGRPFFVMEFINGIELAQLIREGQLALQKKLELCLQICKGLSYAHKNGVIHRDIKPSNIFIDREFNVKILDFGIAALIDNKTKNRSDDNRPHSIKDSESRAEGQLMGTINYMAPELNQSSEKASVQSDIYSLGVIMYELFSGQFPNQSQRLKKAEETPLPKSIANLVMRCLLPEPDKRPKSTIDIHDQLLVLLRGEHLDKIRAKRAKETVGFKKSFALLDILREQKDSAVYLFIEKHSGQKIVIKKMPSNLPAYEIAKKLAKLQHPNITRVHGASKNDRVFIEVVDYQAGGDLQDRLLKRFSVDNFLVFAVQICKAMAFAHKYQIIHGNLRPSNILFDDSDTVKVSDFGLAHHNNVNSKDGEKEFYSQDEPLCPQSDIYACGVVFYLMLFGSFPQFRNKQLQVGRSFKKLPLTLQALLTGMLNKDLLKRTANFSVALRELESLTGDLPTQVWDEESIPLFKKSKITNKLTVFSLMLVAILVLTTTGIVNSIIQFLQ